MRYATSALLVARETKREASLQITLVLNCSTFALLMDSHQMAYAKRRRVGVISNQMVLMR